MNGLTPFLFLIIAAVTLAQVAGNSKRSKNKFDKEQKNRQIDMGLGEKKRKMVGPAQLLKRGETKIDASGQTRTESVDNDGPSFEADGRDLPRTEITDDNNPFEV